MKTHCSMESTVLEGIRSESGSTATREHLLDCRHCAETARVAESLLRIAKAPEPPPGLPGAETLWWRVRLRQSRAPVRRALQPIYRMQRIALGVGIVAGSLVLSTNHEMLTATLRRLWPAETGTSAAASIDPFVVSALIACLLVAQFACALYLSWLED